MGGKIVRTIGIVASESKIGMMNLGYNIRRLVQLERWQLHPLECAHGRSRYGIVQRTARRRPSVKRSPIGDSLGTSAATAARLKAEIAESEYCSRFPWGNRASNACCLLIAVMATSFDFLPIKQFR